MKGIGRDILVGVVATVLSAIVIANWPDARAWLSASQTVSAPRWALLLAWLVPPLAIFVLMRWTRRPKETQPVIAVPLRAPPFAPNQLQDSVVRVLRFADDTFISIEQVAAALEGPPPVADVRQALGQLERAGWAQDRVGDGVWKYRLAGPGLDYARERNYPVMTAEQRRNLRRQDW